MAHIFDSLYPCSFNGVGFLVESSSIAGGRKNVTHEFPNQDNRYVEDLGLLNETITLNACIPTDEYFSGRDALKFALELGGYGTLIHPFYGIRTCAVKSYTIAEDTSSLGDVKITMVFEVAQELNFPGGGVLSVGSVFLAVSSMILSANSYFSSSYNTHSKSGRSLSALQPAFIGNYDRALAAYSSNPFLFEKSPDVRAALESYNDNSGLFLTQPSTFIAKSTDLYKALDAATDTGAAGFKVAKGLIPPVDSTTYTAALTNQQLIIEENRFQVQTHGLVHSFGLMMQNASIIPYSTIHEYVGIRTDVDAQYVRLKDDLAHKESADALLEGVEGAYLAFVQYTANKARDLPFITAVTGNNLPLSVLAFNYYGNTDRVEYLRILNFPDQIDPSYLDGDVDILSGV